MENLYEIKVKKNKRNGKTFYPLSFNGSKKNFHHKKKNKLMSFRLTNKSSWFCFSTPIVRTRHIHSTRLFSNHFFEFHKRMQNFKCNLNPHTHFFDLSEQYTSVLYTMPSINRSNSECSGKYKIYGSLKYDDPKHFSSSW